MFLNDGEGDKIYIRVRERGVLLQRRYTLGTVNGRARSSKNIAAPMAMTNSSSRSDDLRSPPPRSPWNWIFYIIRSETFDQRDPLLSLAGGEI